MRALLLGEEDSWRERTISPRGLEAAPKRLGGSSKEIDMTPHVRKNNPRAESGFQSESRPLWGFKNYPQKHNRLDVLLLSMTSVFLIQSLTLVRAYVFIVLARSLRVHGAGRPSLLPMVWNGM